LAEDILKAYRGNIPEELGFTDLVGQQRLIIDKSCNKELAAFA
jgi:hypothetical protein